MSRYSKNLRSKVIRFDGQPELPFEEFMTPPLPPVIKRQSEPDDNPAGRIINYISFGSGSSGNSCYVGNRLEGLIIDVGVKADFILDTLHANGVHISKVKGILLTHDHADHVKYAYTLLRTHKHLRLFCTPKVLNGMLRRHGVSKRIKDYHVPIFKEIPFKVAGFEVTAFDVPHDGTDNMGFSLNYDNRNFVLATDIANATERARHYISKANYLVLESNYDSRMLLYGPYPEYLKSRIRSLDKGHLDNEDTARLLREIYHKGLKYIFLCHLSKDNNTPEKALECSRRSLESIGLTVGEGNESISDRLADVQLMALPRFSPTRWFVFRP